ncbi:MAG: aminoacyl-tRNA hydrolase [Patescibacteria group bacterium]
MHPSIPIKLIVGLGNPGAPYEATYHNAGFLALQFLESAFLKESGEGKERAWKQDRLFAYRRIGSSIFVKPLVFMNRSGTAVKSALRRFACAPEEMLVLHDDFDIPLGKAKCAFGRGSAGHHGIESISETLRTKGFWRFRIGVRKKPGKAGAFVLSRISLKDREAMYAAVSALTTSHPPVPL